MWWGGKNNVKACAHKRLSAAVAKIKFAIKSDCCMLISAIAIAAAVPVTVNTPSWKWEVDRMDVTGDIGKISKTSIEFKRALLF